MAAPNWAAKKEVPLTKRDASSNPFSSAWRTPFKLPPFEKIKPEHFGPAMKDAMAEQRRAISKIKKDERRPTFSNTILALEKSGLPLSRVVSVFFNLASADTNAKLQEIEREMAPKLAAHETAIYLDSTLMQRIEYLYERRQSLTLTAEQRRLIDRYYTWFLIAGAKLKPKAKRRIAEINERLAQLVTGFMQNVLADEQSWSMVLEDERDLAGLPASVRAAANTAASELGLGPEKHAITLARSSVEGFLTFSSRRDLRQKAFEAWIARGEMDTSRDNRQILAEVVALRGELAGLMGFESFAEYALQDTMAKTPANVRNLLGQVWPAARARAEEECAALAERVRAEGGNFKIAGWDWRYYAQKEQSARFDLDESELRPYFQLENVIAAAFETARRLFGLRFKERTDLPKYHQDVRTFEVTDGRGRHVAVFMADYFARPSKRSGAWMSSYRSQHKIGGDSRPVVVNVMNFARGAKDEATLLSMDDARTLFHEFGHGLHGMLSDVSYPSISGTNVPRDFVELPSQLFEHWLTTPEVLKEFARHHKTGRPMPAKLLKKLKAAEKFNQGFATVEYTACALLDLDLHELGDVEDFDASAFERDALAKIGMPSEIVMRHRLPHFMHIVGGYAAGYYSYMWSEVMDADAFAAFEESGDVFSKKIASKLRKYIYAAGNMRDAQEAYQAFRGRPPQIDGLLKKRGLTS